MAQRGRGRVIIPAKITTFLSKNGHAGFFPYLCAGVGKRGRLGREGGKGLRKMGEGKKGENIQIHY